VEHGPPLRWPRLGASQCVDADTFLEGVVRPDALDYGDAALQAVERLGMQYTRVAPVAHADALPVADTECREVVGVYQGRRASLFVLRGWRFGEASIQIVARRCCDKSEGMLRVDLADVIEVIREAQHGASIPADPLPDRHEVEAVVEGIEAVEEMRLLE